jgi:acetoin:2,6-dichlorophenolindophenol oxidoreductase subunit beta
MTKMRMAHAINRALHEELARDDKVVLFGEDVGISLFGDTRGLLDTFGPQRVRDTPMSEALLAGVAVGAAATGLRPICHLMFGNFLYTAWDAIANQAAKLHYMTGGQVSLPLVYMAVYGGGRSQGAHHSDVPYPSLMNLSGLKVAVPATPADARGMLKAAIRDDDPVVFLQAAGRGGELGDVPDHDYTIPLGLAHVKRTGIDVTIVAVGAMVRVAMKAAEELAASAISAEVLDLRTVFPLDKKSILASVSKTGHVIVVDEARETCGLASEIAAIAADEGFDSLRGPIRRVTVPNVPMPYSPRLEEELIPSQQRVVRAVQELLGRKG